MAAMDCKNEDIPVTDDTKAASGPSFYTNRVISHDEAREIADRLIASHFRKTDKEQARISIPANKERDDDLLIGAYIMQQRGVTARLESALRERDAEIERLERDNGFLRKQNRDALTAEGWMRACLEAREERDNSQAQVGKLRSALENIIPRFEACCRHAGNSDEIVALATQDARAALKESTDGN